MNEYQFILMNGQSFSKAVSLFHLDIEISTEADTSAMGAIMNFNKIIRILGHPARADQSAPTLSP
jgi:hypothetical protein